jgi:hypothetical protein
MKYPDYRGNIKSGDVLAWSHRGWGSLYDFKIQMVRLATRSEYSHVGVAWVVGSRVLVIEAVEPRARLYPLSKLGSFYHIGMDAPWAVETEEAALTLVGVEYRQLEAIRLFFKDREPGNASECAALVLEVLGKDGFDLGRRATPDAVVQAALELGKSLCYVENK